MNYSRLVNNCQINYNLKSNQPYQIFLLKADDNADTSDNID